MNSVLIIFVKGCNVCLFCEIFFRHKLDLLEATCSIKLVAAVFLLTNATAYFNKIDAEMKNEIFPQNFSANDDITARLLPYQLY
jgi:hypothetical protein